MTTLWRLFSQANNIVYFTRLLYFTLRSWFFISDRWTQTNTMNVILFSSRLSLRLHSLLLSPPLSTLIWLIHINKLLLFCEVVSASEKLRRSVSKKKKRNTLSSFKSFSIESLSSSEFFNKFSPIISFLDIVVRNVFHNKFLTQYTITLQRNNIVQRQYKNKKQEICRCTTKIISFHSYEREQ